ncbi:MAG TPA: CcdC protein domain-containing protein [Sphingomonas sp.]|jgi:membrane protein CcdC involved in cytochrome C biogenesis|nr:CcdC protein domain-containing protein [Sphingomonas sp.]
MQPHDQKLVSYAITALLMAVVLAVRWRRMSRVRPLKLERLCIAPALYALAAAAMFAHSPPAGWGWLFCSVALAEGAALGWQRGQMMRITIDPRTHALNQTASPAAMLLLVPLVVVRTGARESLAGGTVLHLNAAAVTDMLIALALGLFTATRVEMYLRDKAVLAAALVRSDP